MTGTAKVAVSTRWLGGMGLRDNRYDKPAPVVDQEGDPAAYRAAGDKITGYECRVRHRRWRRDGGGN